MLINKKVNQCKFDGLTDGNFPYHALVKVFEKKETFIERHPPKMEKCEAEWRVYVEYSLVISHPMSKL